MPIRKSKRHGVPHYSPLHNLSLGNTPGLKLNNARNDFAAIDLKLGHSNGQPKAARTCATGIDVDNSVATLDHRLVRVARHNHVNASGSRVYVELRKIVNSVEVGAIDFEELGFGERICPCASVVVAADCRNRREGGELGKYLSSADIAAVDDVLAASEKSQRLRP